MKLVNRPERTLADAIRETLMVHPDILDSIYSLAVMNSCLIVHYTKNRIAMTLEEPLSIITGDILIEGVGVFELVRDVRKRLQSYTISAVQYDNLIEALKLAAGYIENEEEHGDGHNPRNPSDCHEWLKLCEVSNGLSILRPNGE